MTIKGTPWKRDFVPGSQGITRGYDVQATSKATTPNPNAVLTNGDTGEFVYLWVNDIMADFSLAGSTAQSVTTRTFFGRSFTQPSYTIAGQSPNQERHGELTEFIHSLQRKAVTSGTLTGLTIPHGGIRRGHASMKGVRKGLSAEGYVRSIKRAHSRFTYAPDYSFQFIVSRMRSGLYDDDPVQGRRLKSWANIIQDIIDETKGQAFVDTPSPDRPQVVIPDAAGGY